MLCCPICWRLCGTLGAVISHIQRAHGPLADDRYCPICRQYLSERLVDHCRKLVKEGDVNHAILAIALNNSVKRGSHIKKLAKQVIRTYMTYVKRGGG